MPSFQEYQQQFVQTLNNVLQNTSDGQGTTAPLTFIQIAFLENLINSLPYYGVADWQHAQRGTLANLLAMSLPNSQIAVEPGSNDDNVEQSFSYTGNYYGYRDAFFHGVGLSTAAGNILNKYPGVNSSWWPGYSVAIVSDALGKMTGVSLNQGLLAADLASYHAALLPGLSISYLETFLTGYTPTSAAIAPILADNEGTDIALALASAVTDGTFTTNINAVISAGGPGTDAATWLLFNLWITLKALDYDFDVDGCIRAAMASGLMVPGEIQAGSWWTGGYTGYFPPLNGSDMGSLLNNNAGQGLPEMDSMSANLPGGGGGASYDKTLPNGYAIGFCNWSACNTYRP